MKQQLAILAFDHPMLEKYADDAKKVFEFYAFKASVMPIEEVRAITWSQPLKR